MKKEAAAGTITYSSDNGDYGEIVIRDGKAKFSPTGYGKYVFRWEEYLRTIFVVDTEAPVSVQVQKIEFVGKDGAAKEVSVSENRIKSEVAGEFRITLKAGETEKTYRIAVTADEEQKEGCKSSIEILTPVMGLCIMAAAMALSRKKA